MIKVSPLGSDEKWLISAGLIITHPTDGRVAFPRRDLIRQEYRAALDLDQFIFCCRSFIGWAGSVCRRICPAKYRRVTLTDAVVLARQLTLTE